MAGCPLSQAGRSRRQAASALMPAGWFARIAVKKEKDESTDTLDRWIETQDGWKPAPVGWKPATHAGRLFLPAGNPLRWDKLRAVGVRRDALRRPQRSVGRSVAKRSVRPGA